jgi:hypothetical protein
MINIFIILNVQDEDTTNGNERGKAAVHGVNTPLLLL